MSGDWDDAQEAMNNLRARIAELEAACDRETDWGCDEAIRADKNGKRARVAEARIAELEADLDRNLGLRREAEARLAAVIAQCDYSLGVDYPTRADIVLIRAAATGDTT